MADKCQPRIYYNYETAEQERLLGCFVWYHAAMKEFFHGWRRKAGVAMLVMACCITAAWLRSCFREDSFRMTVCGRRNLIISSSSRLCWWSWNEPS